MPLLELHDVVAGYGPVPTLDGLTLAVDAGTVVALVGRNGAGKTTLLRAAAGLLRPRRGRVTVDGHDLATLSVRAAARLVSGVPQDDAVEAPFRVREVVALGRLAHVSPWRAAGAADHAAVADALAATDLASLADRRVDALSGGERRRVAVARCLAQGAPLLLLDEPTAHLDLGQEARLLDVVRRLARERGRAVVAALHDVNLAATFADRVLLVEAGRVVADGAPADVLTAPRLSALFGLALRVVADPERGVPIVVPGAAP